MTAVKTESGSVPADDRLANIILVKDNFFKEDLANFIAKGTEAYQWRYHHKSDVHASAHNKFFVSYLWDQSSGENFFLMLWNLIRDDVSCVADCYCWRIIANGQIKGQNGNWHRDHGDKTVLYFPSKWMPDWGGSTHFKTDTLEKEIPYRQNRLIIFNSQVPHYGSCPAIDNVLRVSIAFNLRT